MWQIWEATTAKRMKIDLYCQRQNCSPLNVLFANTTTQLVAVSHIFSDDITKLYYDVNVSWSLTELLVETEPQKPSCLFLNFEVGSVQFLENRCLKFSLDSTHPYSCGYKIWFCNDVLFLYVVECSSHRSSYAWNADSESFLSVSGRFHIFCFLSANCSVLCFILECCTIYKCK